eukprot:scaffold63498_cov18-Tisochrysis_lutea.AAC.2
MRVRQKQSIKCVCWLAHPARWESRKKESCSSKRGWRRSVKIGAGAWCIELAATEGLCLQPWPRFLWRCASPATGIWALQFSRVDKTKLRLHQSISLHRRACQGPQ